MEAKFMSLSTIASSALEASTKTQTTMIKSTIHRNAKFVKGDQDSPMHHNEKTCNWCLNHSDDKGVWVVHVPDYCKASDKSNTWFQKPIKSKHDNQTEEQGDRRLKLSDNIQASLMQIWN